MDDLFLVKSHVDTEFLRSWGGRHQHLGPKNDFGYVIHAILELLFRKNRPQSFYFDRSNNSLYFYSTLSRAQLADQLINKNMAACFGLGLGSCGRDCEVNDITSLIAKNPQLSFQIQTSPIKRLTGSRREVDVFRAADGSEKDRHAEYEKWLHTRLGETGMGDVIIDDVVIEQHSVLRREKKLMDSNNRTKVVIDVPVALFTGTFTVRTRQCFLETLLKGIGRHKAFGLGMLLITFEHAHKNNLPVQ
jgi:CRISPR system Cascade subunit CasE